MAFTLTKNALLKAMEASKEPQLVLEIDGVPTIYGTTSILEYIRIGDVGLFIDGSWVIGGFRSIEDQESLLSFDGNAGTTTKITQTLDPEKGRGSSIPSLSIGLIDKDQEITNLIAPGNVVEDVMGRRCRVYLGFNDTAFKADFIPIFKGIIDDVDAGAGFVKFTIGSPDQKKKSEVFQKTQTNLDGSITNSQTTITVESTTNFLYRKNKPDGTPETAFSSYIRIEDEIIEYSTVNATQFLGCTRGALGTIAVSHDDEVGVDSFYRLTGNGIDLALKLMLSGHEDYFTTGVEIHNFNFIDPSLTVANSIFFSEIDVTEVYGLTEGDFLTTTGAANGANNVSMKTINEIVVNEDGSYVVVNDVTFVTETDSAATVSFRSQYDSLGIGAGLKMIPDDVDVTQHIYLKNFTRFGVNPVECSILVIMGLNCSGFWAEMTL